MAGRSRYVHGERVCPKCGAKEADGDKFSRRGNWCCQCIKAYYQEQRKSVAPKLCKDCSAPTPSRRHSYCSTCGEKHVEIRKAERPKRIRKTSDAQERRNDLRARERLILRARRTCEDCGILLPIETVDIGNIKYCDPCASKRKNESSALRQRILYHRIKAGEDVHAGKL
jgi:hypothetical protein